MSKKGEINRLSSIGGPHIAIITNIGEAHIENFKNLNGIAETNADNTGLNNNNNNHEIDLYKYFQYFSKKACKK